MSDHEHQWVRVRTHHRYTTLATTPEALNHITRQLHVMAERSHQ